MEWFAAVKGGGIILSTPGQRKELDADDYIRPYTVEYIHNQEIWDQLPVQPIGMSLIERDVHDISLSSIKQTDTYSYICQW